jgi:hypothetical protein
MLTEQIIMAFPKGVNHRPARYIPVLLTLAGTKVP